MKAQCIWCAQWTPVKEFKTSLEPFSHPIKRDNTARKYWAAVYADDPIWSF